MVLAGERAGVPAGVPTEAEVLGRAAGENFPVASRLLLGPARGHLLALYGFARLVDDLGDRAPGDRLALLNWADGQIDEAAAGRGDHPVFRRLGPTITACRLPAGPFHDLVEANRRDQVVTRYATFGDLLEYCRLSANPVGRLVLGVFGVTGAAEADLSDAVCTGLQLVEHCQDVAEDAAAGRIYLPEEDLRRFGVTEDDVLAPAGGAGLRRVIGFETTRARRMLARGAGLIGLLRGRPRLAVAGFVSGGLAAADALEAAAYDVTAGAPRPRRARLAAHWLGLVVRGPAAAGAGTDGAGRAAQ